MKYSRFLVSFYVTCSQIKFFAAIVLFSYPISEYYEKNVSDPHLVTHNLFCFLFVYFLIVKFCCYYVLQCWFYWLWLDSRILLFYFFVSILNFTVDIFWFYWFPFFTISISTFAIFIFLLFKSRFLYILQLLNYMAISVGPCTPDLVALRWALYTQSCRVDVSLSS